VVTPSKCPGRTAPQKFCVRPGTDTFVAVSLVTLERARIGLEIFTLAKLRRVYENADNDPLSVFARQLDQRQVPGMQITHRRHERDVFVMMTPLSHLFGHFLFCMYYQHVRL
jgi:hypothetical protein